jgi:hypothetical protein
MPRSAAVQPVSAPVVAHVTWTPSGAVGPVRLRRRDAERDLLAAPAALIGQVRVDGVVVDGAGVPIKGAPQVELPATLYGFHAQGREIVTLAAVLRPEGYAIDKAPRTASKPRWVPVAEGAALYATRDDAQLAGELGYCIRRLPKSKHPRPVFTV